MEQPTPEQVETYRAVMRYYSWLGNIAKAEKAQTDPRYREKGAKNLVKARAALAKKRAEAKRNSLSGAEKRTGTVLGR